MKYLILLCAALLGFMPASANAKSEFMPIQVKMVNLAEMPLKEAIDFCNKRNMGCYALRDKYAAQEGIEETVYPTDTKIPPTPFAKPTTYQISFENRLKFKQATFIVE